MNELNYLFRFKLAILHTEVSKKCRKQINHTLSFNVLKTLDKNNQFTEIMNIKNILGLQLKRDIFE